MKNVLMTLLMVGFCGVVWGQQFPDRSVVREGNRAYHKESYTDAEVLYRRALEQNPELYEAQNNMAGALYKQERYDEAAQAGEALVQGAKSPEQAADAYYNQGNALFKQRKLTEALEAYKNALRINPSDMEAKFNLAYTQKLLEEGENEDQNDQNKDQDENQDQNQDENQDQNEEQNDQGEDDQEQEQQGDDQQDQEQQNEGKQPQSGMTQEEAANLLDAMQEQENDTKEKVDAQKVKSVGRSGKNW